MTPKPGNALSEDEREALRLADLKQQAMDWQQRRWVRKNGKRWRGFSYREHKALVERLERSRRLPERAPRK